MTRFVSWSLSFMVAGLLASLGPALARGENAVGSTLQQARQALRETIEQSRRQEQSLLDAKRKALRAILGEGRRELKALDHERAGVEREVMALAGRLRAGEEGHGEAATLKARQENLEAHARVLRERLARAEAELQWLEELQQRPRKGSPESPPRASEPLPSGTTAAWVESHGERLRAEKLQQLMPYL